jgi:branched-chain amino acid transport system substrate-binding protein
MRRGLLRLAFVGGAIALVSTCITVVVPGAGAATSSPITIGYVADLSGVAASSFVGAAGGAEARVDEQNAEGGVNGHKLKLVVEDDQSSPSGNLTASQDLVENKGVFGVINFSAFTFAAAKYLNQQGIPVVGYGLDGPEWGQQPNTNMFTLEPSTSTEFGTNYYTSTDEAKFIKSIGVTKMAGLAYGISPSSQQSVRDLFTAAGKMGISDCYSNYSVPFGSVDFTADALQMKQAGCNGVVGSFVDSSDVGLSQTLKNAGIDAPQLYFTGYDQTILGSPSARQASNGDYYVAPFDYSHPNTATKAMLSALKKYDPTYDGGIPGLGLYGSYLSADLMIFGLEHAGKNPTRTSFITNLRKVGSYNAGGILPAPTTFQHFGTPAMLGKTGCAYFAKLTGPTFTIVSGRAICGNYIKVPASS